MESTYLRRGYEPGSTTVSRWSSLIADRVVGRVLYLWLGRTSENPLTDQRCSTSLTALLN